MSDVPALREVVEVGCDVVGVLDGLTVVPLKREVLWEEVLLELFRCEPVGVTRTLVGDEIEGEVDEVELPLSEEVDVWLEELV